MSANVSIPIDESWSHHESTTKVIIKHKRKYWIIVYVVNVCATEIIFGLLDGLGDNTLWHGLTLGREKSSGDYCEQARFNRFLHNPANSISNLGFIFFGQMEFLFELCDWNVNKCLSSVSNLTPHGKEYRFSTQQLDRTPFVVVN